MNNSPMETPSRDAYFDNAKYILIVFVVLGHSMSYLGMFNSSIYNLIYLFHMPAFIAIVGHFAKFSKIQKIGQTAFQYIVFQTLYYGFIICVLGNKNITVQYTSPYSSQYSSHLWFLLSIISWKLFMPFFSRLKHPILLSVIVAVLAGYDKSIGAYLSLSRTIVFMPFFLIGHYAKREDFEKLKKFSFVVPLIIFSVSFILLSKITTSHTYGWLYGNMPYAALMGNKDIFIAGVYRLILLSWAAVAVAGFFMLVPQKKQWYTNLGTRTIQPFLLQIFVLETISAFGIIKFFITPLQKILFFILLFLITTLLSTRFVEILTLPFIWPVRFKKYLTKIFVPEHKSQ